MRNQIGIPEQAAAIEPLGEFTLPQYNPPIDEQVMIQEALQSRPDIHAALARSHGTYSAVRLAKGDRIPTPIIGPQYAMDEAGSTVHWLRLDRPASDLEQRQTASTAARS